MLLILVLLDASIRKVTAFEVEGRVLGNALAQFIEKAYLLNDELGAEPQVECRVRCNHSHRDAAALTTDRPRQALRHVDCLTSSYDEAWTSVAGLCFALAKPSPQRRPITSSLPTTSKVRFRLANIKASLSPSIPKLSTDFGGAVFSFPTSRLELLDHLVPDLPFWALDRFRNLDFAIRSPPPACLVLSEHCLQARLKRKHVPNN
ncbi:hypothetical protein VTI74DRAFT_7711 [Chaetomium olivicolor]